MVNLKVIVASENKGKIEEIKSIFDSYEILTMKEASVLLGKELKVNENKDTFIGNALQKADELYNQVGDNYLCIADDSGLSIDELDGFPGVFTARWLDADDHIKNLELLKKMKDVEKQRRICHYTTAIAIKGVNIEKTFEYTLDGFVANNFRGLNGFGFDEIFELSNGLTLAEISTKEKLLLSPRKHALKMVEEFLNMNKDI